MFLKTISTLMVLILVSLGFRQCTLAQDLDQTLRLMIAEKNIITPDIGGNHSVEQISLGQALFFDRELSGNRDTSCATCHHPRLASTDGLSLPVGTGTVDIGKIGLQRGKGHDREFVPRNAPEIFNRGSTEWVSMFWDSRVVKLPDGSFLSPAGSELLPGLDSVLSIQAMFPVTSRDEMRGKPGDKTFEGDVNEIAEIPDGDFRGIWSALMDRLLAIEGYRELFMAAYPEKDLQDLTFAHAAKAIAAFEINAFSHNDSPFDRYLSGMDSSLSAEQKRGAILFFGDANCVNCHSGSLLTDQKHWNIGVPQLGPGKAGLAPLDLGRFLESGESSDLFAFRTPPLRNVEKTGPYMHNGAYSDLESVVRHHANPTVHLWNYWPELHVDQEELWPTVQNDPVTLASITGTLDNSGPSTEGLNDREIKDIVAFLRSLTSQKFDKKMKAIIPDEVPSGLPVE